ncbi:GH92 family glycosyl hydrolase [Curtobacterium sp. MCPF17_001]|uniref:GH92 family glycosyl hydrolase n=1 Tax=Curtobacterium sp. MCPF17_001 TaxID=2175651 RepID=UPI0021ACEF4B|nr:GH92 family glycosyl hydrolase [Curtobacterium sp. MCPF17_001]
MTSPRVHRRPLLRPFPLAAAATIAALLGTGVVASPATAAPATSPAGATTASRPVTDPAASVDPFIGTSHDGNTWPGATAPFGMLQWSPTGTKGDQTSTPVANGYSYDVNRLRGFSLTHLNGAGCAPGAAGDVPIMPITTAVTTSPSADSTDAVYAAGYSHDQESASPGRYGVQLDNGVRTDLAVTTRAGIGEFAFPAGKDANLLFRTSNSINGSEAADTRVDARTRTVSGSVLTGGFCSRRGNGGGATNPDRRSYYRLYFTATFDRDFTSTGTWKDGTVQPGGTRASGGEGYLTGADRAGRGSGAWVGFDARRGATVHAKIGISYVSAAGAVANRDAEVQRHATVASVAAGTRASWNRELSRIRVGGGTADRTTQLYTSVYHALMQPNTLNDRDGRYLGPDMRVHRIDRGHAAVYGTYSGWDQYRAQIQLLALLRPDVAGDMAQSMLRFAQQNGGIWDRWLHLGAPTHVMTGDPSAATLATWYAMGVRNFDVQAAYQSLKRQATVENADAESDIGCPGQCLAQRPALDEYLQRQYAANDDCSCWGGAAETLEDSISDSALGSWAGSMGLRSDARMFAERGTYWKNTFNAAVGYQAARQADGTWTPGWSPSTGTGFAQGTSAQYTWLVPQDVSGLSAALGGDAAAVARLDAFFHDAAGNFAVTGGDATKFDPTNEPDIHTPWMYNALGQPWKTQETVRRVVDDAYSTGPGGLPGNDDLGTMSAWYVFASIGLFPQTPGRAEMLIGSPTFSTVDIRRSSGQRIVIRSSGTEQYVQGARLDGRTLTKSWVPSSFVNRGGRLSLRVGSTPDTEWATAPRDRPQDR